MAHIISRHAEDDFIAHQIATGMEKAGASVFSIASDGQAKYPTAMASHTRFIVFAKYEPPLTPDLIDMAIDRVTSGLQDD